MVYTFPRRSKSVCDNFNGIREGDRAAINGPQNSEDTRRISVQPSSRLCYKGLRTIASDSTEICIAAFNFDIKHPYTTTTLANPENTKKYRADCVNNNK